MHAAPTLRAIITKLADKHAMNLDEPGAYLRLSLPWHGQLVIENIGANRISIANYVQVHSDWLTDPEIVVFVDRRPSAEDQAQIEQTWYPIEATEVFGGWRLYAELDSWGALVLYDPAGQIELADFAENVVARHLIDHDWLDQAVRSTTPVPSWTPDDIRRRDIRIDEASLSPKEVWHE
jgi:hypothetical protein